MPETPTTVSNRVKKRQMCSKAPAISPLDASSLHPKIQHLAFLLGTWKGQGQGYYPTIESFKYYEELTFSHVGKPFIIYNQKTWSFDQRSPLHFESGYIRCLDPAKLEMLVCDPTGTSQLYTGTVDTSKKTIIVSTNSVGLTPTAKEVKEVHREFTFDENTEGDVARLLKVPVPRLSYKLSMAAVGQPLLPHLDAVLEKEIHEISVEAFAAIEAEKNEQGTESKWEIVDVQESSEFEKGHITGALNIPLGELLRELVNIDESAKLKQLRDKNVVVYCRRGPRAQLALQALQEFKLPSNVYNLSGGFVKWQEAK